MKKCGKCGIEKDLSEFYNNICGIDGKCSQCKTCTKEYNNKRRQKISSKEKYTPDEAKMYFLALEYSITYLNNNGLDETTSFILRNKDRFTDGCKEDMVLISKFQIETFGGDGLLETREYVRLLKRFVKGLND